MGNNPGKARQASGDDTGPSLTTGQLIYQTSMDDSDSFDPIDIKRARASTMSPGEPRPTHDAEKLLPTVFKWEGGGKEVYISGTFNNWKHKIAMTKSHGEFCTIIELPLGDHQYKFYVDGAWVHDPSEPTATNEMGSLNNSIGVKRSDFEVFEALAIDSINSLSAKKRAEISGSPPGDYAQDIPPRRLNEKHAGPPILPPHLLQVILNKDTPVHCEPTLLPEPHHVMLNHLYALSIKDGVMVLSATHRFRKKYVTTLLYKPI